MIDNWVLQFVVFVVSLSIVCAWLTYVKSKRIEDPEFEISTPLATFFLLGFAWLIGDIIMIIDNSTFQGIATVAGVFPILFGVSIGVSRKIQNRFQNDTPPKSTK